MGKKRMGLYFVHGFVLKDLFLDEFFDGHAVSRLYLNLIRP
jgi:hypothetical protein